jgi:phosphohistidine phosphatase
MKNFIGALDVILTSPLLRAHQTGQIFGKVLECENIIQTDVLRPPCRLRDVIEVLAQQQGAERVLCVGHDPSLGEIATELITGINEENFFPFEKGGILRMDMETPTASIDARLIYFLDSSIPRALGELTANIQGIELPDSGSIAGLGAYNPGYAGHSDSNGYDDENAGIRNTTIRLDI